MDKFPLTWNGKSIGELIVEWEAMYTWFAVRGKLPDGGLWCAWIVGERGELRLGILEPMGSGAAIRRRFSHPMTAHLGRILRGELRPAAGIGKDTPWEAVSEPEKFFHTPWICKQLQGMRGALVRQKNGMRELALPYEKTKPFPLPAIFCFARWQRVQEKDYVCFTFGKDEVPVMQKMPKK